MLLVASLSFLFLLIVIPLATIESANAGVFDFFCQSVRAGVASGPQQNGCLLQGLGQLANNLQQNQQNVNLCPSGSILVGVQCIPNQSSTAANPLVCPTGFVLSGNSCVQQIVNTIPVANAGTNQVVNSSASVMLNGLGSFATTSGATITSYAWTQISGTTVSLTNPNTGTPTFTAPASATSLSFSLVVIDSYGLSSTPSTVQVTVT